MGIGSFLGLGGGARSPGTQSTGFNRWEKQGKISFDKAINKSSMPYHNSKKVRDFMEAKLAGKRLSHDRIIKEIKKEFGYNLGKRVEKALTPKMKQELQKPSFHEQALAKKEFERKKLGKLARYKEARREEEEAYKSTKGAWEGEQRLGFGWQAGQQQQSSDQDKGSRLDKRPEFQGIGSSTNKPASPPPDASPKTPPSPIIPLSR
ncbi:hypothetical protein KAU19_02490 [Candidatus Parcubacteria bacterium]|nr:hypothetical protein [Candidatus Parcubacteria bacterium]